MPKRITCQSLPMIKRMRHFGIRTAYAPHTILLFLLLCVVCLFIAMRIRVVYVCGRYFLERLWIVGRSGERDQPFRWVLRTVACLAFVLHGLYREFYGAELWPTLEGFDEVDCPD